MYPTIIGLMCAAKGIAFCFQPHLPTALLFSFKVHNSTDFAKVTET